MRRSKASDNGKPIDRTKRITKYLDKDPFGNYIYRPNTRQCLTTNERPTMTTNETLNRPLMASITTDDGSTELDELLSMFGPPIISWTDEDGNIQFETFETKETV